MSDAVYRLAQLTMQLRARLEAFEKFATQFVDGCVIATDQDGERYGYQCAECACKLPSWNPDNPRDASFLQCAEHDAACLAERAMRVFVEAPKVDN